jgi:Arrestin (or S-antigen), C-terminal domain
MGINASVCRSNVSLEKNYFVTGETIRAHIAVDNSECKKALKWIKVKLERRIDMIGFQVFPFQSDTFGASLLNGNMNIWGDEKDDEQKIENISYCLSTKI